MLSNDEALLPERHCLDGSSEVMCSERESELGHQEVSE
jgi:hypothetical protein